MIFFFVGDSGILGKGPSAPLRNRTNGDPPITSSDVLALSYWRLVEAGPLTQYFLKYSEMQHFKSD